MNAVDHPKHYNAHPDGMECIELVERMPFNTGNAVKYLWRAGLKGAALEDLKKTRWYIVRQSESEYALENDDNLMNCGGLIRRACMGFPALYASAISHIIQDEFDLALHAIDALIVEASA